MMPTWIKEESKAQFNVEARVDGDIALAISSDTKQYENIFKMGLIGPDILKRKEDITVRMKVGVILPEPSQPAAVPDPISFMITDGERGIGMTLMDPRSDYDDTGPYRSVEGNVEGRVLDPDQAAPSVSQSTNTRVNPDQFEMNFLPSETFGTAYCALDDGHKFVATYSRALKLNQGLNLELYRKEPEEEYTINYIEVGVYRNSPAIEPNEPWGWLDGPALSRNQRAQVRGWRRPIYITQLKLCVSRNWHCWVVWIEPRSEECYA